MSPSTQEAILIAINERAKELAAMYAITKEQQVLDVLAGRVLNEVDRIEKTMREFDGVATSKFALAIEKGLTNVGAKIADGALKESLKVSHNCSIEIKKSTDKVSGVVAEASKYFNAFAN